MRWQPCSGLSRAFCPSSRARAACGHSDGRRRIDDSAGGRGRPRTYVTGEGQHWTFFDAEELRLNVFYAGHYATETVGVTALAEHLYKKFDLPWVFLDHPTGL